MTSKPPGSLSHLERLIDTRSRSDADAVATAGRLRRLVAVPVLASMLDALSLDGEPRLAFKGGGAEAGSFSLIEPIPTAIDMSRVQLGPMDDVAVLGVHYQIAQKLYACTEFPVEGADQRAHDLYDIMLTADLARAAGLDQTLAACVDTFAHRNKHAWPPVLPDWPDWPAIWDGMDLPESALVTYADAREGVASPVIRLQ